MNRWQAARRNWKRILILVVVAVVVLLVLIQLIPINRTNPAVAQEPDWDSAATRTLAKDACFDCHSNETVWPWYSKLAPVSWLLWRDVDEGRSKLNFSEWNGRHEEADEIIDVIDSGEMPPWYYVIMHSEAKLSDSDKEALISGMRATLGQSDGD